MKNLKHKVDRDLCKHAYTDTVEAVSRLAAYATSRSLKVLGHGEYYTVAENLCRKDLLILSISARRFAEISQTTYALKSRNIRISDQVSMEARERKSDSAWNIVGNIIHGNELTIFKEVGKLEYAAGKVDAFTSVMMTEEFDAAISIKSDKFERKYFALTDLLEAVNSYIEEVSDSIEGVYLGSAYEM